MFLRLNLAVVTAPFAASRVTELFFARIMELLPDIQILSPRDIGMEANSRAMTLMETMPYNFTAEKEENSSGEFLWDDDFNLFSNV